MKIIFVYANHYPGGWDVKGNLIIPLSKYLYRHGCFSEAWEMNAASNKVNYGGELITKLFKHHNQSLFIGKRIKKTISRLSPENTCIHFLGAFQEINYHLANICRAKKIRYIYSPLGLLSKSKTTEASYFKRNKIRKKEIPLLKDAHAVHTLGSKQFRDLHFYTKVDHKFLLPMGYYTKDIMFNDLHIPKPDVPVFLFTGEINWSISGLRRLHEGFERYKDLGGKGVLWFMGRGKHEEHLRAVIDHSFWRDFMTFWDYNTRNEWLNVIFNADVQIYPVKSAVFPKSLIIGAAMGIPAVVSTHSNLGTYLENHQAGICLRSTRSLDICEALMNIDKDWSTGHLSIQKNYARNMAYQGFHWEKLIHEYMNMYTGARIIRPHRYEPRVFPLLTHQHE